METNLTLQAMRQLLRLDEGYFNEGGLHFFSTDGNEIAVMLELEHHHENSSIFLSLEGMSVDLFLDRYQMAHLEYLEKFDRDWFWQEYEKGQASIIVRVGSAPQLEKQFTLRHGKMEVLDVRSEKVEIIDSVIKDIYEIEKYVLKENGLTLAW